MVRVRDVVIIGASAGGVDALKRLLGGLPDGLAASVLIVLHTHPGKSLQLPETLSRFGRLPAAYAVAGQRLTAGMLTVAPPRQHLVITAGDLLQLHRGPLVNYARPAIDPLLQSAAQICGARTIAVVLSGSLTDGAEGVAAVAAAGGTVLAQAPHDARYPDMPRAALDRAPGAVALPADALGPAIADLVASTPMPSVPTARVPPPTESSLDAALWLAVRQLRTHAAAQQRFHQRLRDTNPLFAQTRDGAIEALRAADIITAHILSRAGPAQAS